LRQGRAKAAPGFRKDFGKLRPSRAEIDLNARRLR
jgi:hypothetical protein